MIHLKKYYKPDFSVVVTYEYSFKDKIDYKKHSILLDEGVMVVETCDENGYVLPSHDWNYKGRYYACRLNGENIEVCIAAHGWIPVYDNIQAAYNDIIAERELLEN